MEQTRRGFLGLLAGATALGATASALRASSQPEDGGEEFRRRFAKASNQFEAAWPGGGHFGYFEVSVEMMERLLPSGTRYDFYEGIGGYDYGWLEKALLLPSNARIEAVSQHYMFLQRTVVFRVECPDFPAREEASTIPKIEPMYRRGADGLPEFAGWSF